MQGSAELADAIGGFYGGLPHDPIRPVSLPWIGGDFISGARGRVRIVAVGINAYHGEPEPPSDAREWLASWFRERRYRYQKAVVRRCAALGTALGVVGAYDELDGLYATNAVKRLLPAGEGKRSNDVRLELFDESASVWRAELLALDQHGVLPHIVAVFGARAWAPTWTVLAGLCEDGAAPSFRRYVPLDGSPASRHAAFHHFNVVEIRDGGRERPMLLVKLPHPAGRSAAWTPQRLSELPEFQSAVARM